jgi:hypothetical protein
MGRRALRGGTWARTFAGAAAAAALHALAVVAPGAGADWTAPFHLSPPGEPASAPQVAVDDAGGAVFAWQLEGSEPFAQTRARAANGTLSAIENLSLTDAPAGQGYAPDVAPAPGGAAVYAWIQQLESPSADYKVLARGRSASGELRPIRNLSPMRDAIEDVHAAVDSDGDAAFVWEARVQGLTRIEGRTLSAAGLLSPLLVLSAPDQRAINPKVAVDAEGEAVFTWQRFDTPAAAFRVETRTLSADGTLGSISQVSSSRWSSVDPQVAVSPAGAGLFIWSSIRADGVGSRIEMRGLTPDGTLIRRQTISDDTGDERHPQVAIDDSGAGLFAWHVTQGSREQLRLRARSALGALGPMQVGRTVFAPQSLSAPRVAVDADGDAVAAWERFDATAGAPPCCEAVEARTRAASGALGPVRTLSEPAREVSGTEVAVNDDSAAVVTWSRAGRVQAGAGP